MGIFKKMTQAQSDRAKKAILISLGVSFVAFGLKFTGFLITGSSSVFSDAAESFVHLFAVGFATYGLYMSRKPADEDHHYGHERIGFFSVGMEGMLILAAGLLIIYRSVESMIFGIEVHQLGTGIIIITLSAVVNLLLGLYLVRTGRRENDMILVGNGKHTLTDVYTSSGVVITLVLVEYSGILIFDALVAIGLALFIMYEGKKLISYSLQGLMDQRNPEQHQQILNVLRSELPEKVKGWHNLRHRTTGKTTWLELHLSFNKDITLDEAHRQATVLEKKIMKSINGDAVVTIHTEPEETQEKAHKILKGINDNEDLERHF